MDDQCRRYLRRVSWRNMSADACVVRGYHEARVEADPGPVEWTDDGWPALVWTDTFPLSDERWPRTCDSCETSFLSDELRQVVTLGMDGSPLERRSPASLVG